MADFSKATQAITDLSAKVDAQNAEIANLKGLLAAVAPAPVVDDQPAVDALVVQVDAIAAKIPA